MEEDCLLHPTELLNAHKYIPLLLYTTAIVQIYPPYPNPTNARRLEGHAAHALYAADLTATLADRASFNTAATFCRTRALTIVTMANTVVGNVLFDTENGL